MRELFRISAKQLAVGAFLALFISCKSAKVINSGVVNKNLSAKAIIKTHYLNAMDFKTMAGKMKIAYSDGEDNQGATVSLRMKKDEVIWLSAPFGVVKAKITPSRISFYNKLENNYFDGDFSYLSDLLGTDVDFVQLQNLLLGQSLFDLTEGKYDMALVNDNYQLQPRKIAALFSTLFQIEPKNFKIATQQLAQPLKKRLLEINYENYQKIDNHVLPGKVKITAIDKALKNTITIEYRNIEFNKALNFPYKTPKGFKEIVLEKDDI